MELLWDFILVEAYLPFCFKEDLPIITAPSTREHSSSIFSHIFLRQLEWNHMHSGKESFLFPRCALGHLYSPWFSTPTSFPLQSCWQCQSYLCHFPGTISHHFLAPLLCHLLLFTIFNRVLQILWCLHFPCGIPTNQFKDWSPSPLVEKGYKDAIMKEASKKTPKEMQIKWYRFSIVKLIKKLKPLVIAELSRTY